MEIVSSNLEMTNTCVDTIKLNFFFLYEKNGSNFSNSNYLLYIRFKFRVHVWKTFERF